MPEMINWEQEILNSPLRSQEDYAPEIDWEQRILQSPKTPIPSQAPSTWDMLKSEAKEVALAPPRRAVASAQALMPLLEYFDRPRNALATGVMEGAWGGPEGSFAGGFKKGLTGQKRTSWGDVLGVRAGRSEDSWPGWLGRQGGRLALDIGLDPLLAFGPLSKAAKASPVIQKAGKLLAPAREWAAGTDIGKALYQTVKTPAGKELESLIMKSQRRANDLTREGLAKAGVTKQAMDEAFKGDWRNTPRELRRLYEHKKDLDPAVKQALDEQLAYSEWLVDLHDQTANWLGKSTIGKVPREELEFVPRPQSPKGQRLSVGKRAKLPSEQQMGSRILKAVKDPVTGETLLDEAGKPVVTKKWMYDVEGSPHTAVTTYKGKEYPVGEASLNEIETGLPYLEGAFVSHPAQAFAVNAAKKSESIAFLELLKDLREAKKIRYGNSETKGWRKINVRGLDEYYAPKWMANQLENRAWRLGDSTDVGMGFVGDLLSAFAKTRFGQGVRDYNQWWKNNILPLHPAYQAGNIVSNVGMQGSGGMAPISWFRRMHEAVNLTKVPEKKVLPGLTGGEFQAEMEARNLLGTGFYGGEAAQPLLEIPKEGGRIRSAVSRVAKTVEPHLPITAKYIETKGNRLADIGEAWDRLNQRGYAFGQRQEDIARGALALDYLKRNAVNFASLSAEGRIKALDDAAQHAKTYMVDYLAGTPFDQLLTNAFPFWKWNRGILRQFRTAATENPARLAQIGRVYESLLQPPSEQDYGVMPDWMQQNVPFGEVMGKQIPGEGGTQSIGLAGRFIPWTNIQQLGQAPLETLRGMIGPGLKVIPALAGYDIERAEWIDPLATGPQAYSRPIFGGGDYSQAWGSQLGVQLPKAYDYLARTLLPARGINLVTQAGMGLGILPSGRQKPLGPEALALYMTTGLKNYPFDRYRYASKKRRDLDDNIKRLMWMMRNANKYGESRNEKERIRQMLIRANREKAKVLGGY